MDTKQTTRESIEATRLEREKLKLAQEQKEFQETGKITFKTEDKSEIEFSRYKQDCRKKAFDLAWNEKSILLQQGKGELFDVNATADSYYEWLISIPKTNSNEQK